MRASGIEQLLADYQSAYRELALDDEDGRIAAANAALGLGFLMGACLPGAAASLALLFRRAYPGLSLPHFFEGEETL